MASKVALLAGGVVAYVGGVFVVRLMLQPSATQSTESQRIHAFDEHSVRYDADIDMHERASGIDVLRKRLIERSSGKVLEVAVGTGRNLEAVLQQQQVDSFIGIDASDGMLAQAGARLSKLHAPHVKLVRADAQALPFDSGTFDTVIDTFGICSMERPVDALREWARVVRADGAILLLEHGRSDYAWLNWLLDRFTPGHVQRHGCYWNRDIAAIVAAAGLHVRERQRHHLGTTYVFVCSPRLPPVDAPSCQSTPAGVARAVQPQQLQ